MPKAVVRNIKLVGQLSPRSGRSNERLAFAEIHVIARRNDAAISNRHAIFCYLLLISKAVSQRFAFLRPTFFKSQKSRQKAPGRSHWAVRLVPLFYLKQQLGRLHSLSFRDIFKRFLPHFFCADKDDLKPMLAVFAIQDQVPFSQSVFSQFRLMKPNITGHRDLAFAFFGE